MRPDIGRWPAVATGLVLPGLVVPGVAGGATDPSMLLETPWLRMLLSFLLVVPVGWAMLVRYEGLVDQWREASMDRPFVSLFYGLFGHILVVFVGGVVWLQLLSLGVDLTALLVVGAVALGAVMLGLAGLGFAVVGTSLTELGGMGHRWHGLVVVATVGAVGWVLPVVGGLAVWSLLVAAGIGGATRKWVHSERTVEAEIED